MRPWPRKAVPSAAPRTCCEQPPSANTPLNQSPGARARWAREQPSPAERTVQRGVGDESKASEDGHGFAIVPDSHGGKPRPAQAAQQAEDDGQRRCPHQHVPHGELKWPRGSPRSGGKHQLKPHHASDQEQQSRNAELSENDHAPLVVGPPKPPQVKNHSKDGGHHSPQEPSAAQRDPQGEKRGLALCQQEESPKEYIG